MSRLHRLGCLRRVPVLLALLLAGCKSGDSWVFSSDVEAPWQKPSAPVAAPPCPVPPSIQRVSYIEPEGEPKKPPEKKEEKDSEATKPPKTLLEWAVGKKDEKNDENGKEEKNGEEEEKPMPHDRPHVADSSQTVGLGRVMLEAGYKFAHDNDRGVRDVSHSYPEGTLRVGMFAEWFELRIGWNYNNETQTENGVRESLNGADDLDLGFRVALTEQKKWLPETALTVDLFVPTGSNDFTSNRFLPEVRYHYTWELVKDRLTLEGNTAAGGTRDDSGHDYLEVLQVFAVEYLPVKQLELFAEWFALIPHGAADSTTGPEQYLHGGGTYLLNTDFGVDVHAAIGLNKHASDYFVGAGFVARY